MFVCVNEWVLANDSYSVRNRLRLVLRTDSGWGGEAVQGLGSPSPRRGQAVAVPGLSQQPWAHILLLWASCGALL